MTDDEREHVKPDETEDMEADSMSALGQLSYRRLIWRRFRKSKLGLIAGVILVVFYIVAIGADFFAPYHYNAISIHLRHVPPQRLHFSFSKGPHVYGLKSVRNPETLELEFTQDPEQIHPIRPFHRDANGKYHIVSSDGRNQIRRGTSLA